MKTIVLVFAAVLLTVSGMAQRTADIGIWGGTSTYFGDLHETSHFDTFNPNFGAYFRYNFNARVGLRAMFLTGNFAKKGTIENTPWSFDKSVQDLSLQVEINYLKYIMGVKNSRFSPYITAGVGLMYFPYNLDPTMIYVFNPNHNKGLAVIDESVIATTIPFGFGMKFSVGQKLGIGVEYQMRKIFDDKLDNLDDPLAHSNNNKIIKYTDYLHNNDFTGYLGVHLTYMIYMGKNACPAYDSINW